MQVMIFFYAYIMFVVGMVTITIATILYFNRMNEYDSSIKN